MDPNDKRAERDKDNAIADLKDSEDSLKTVEEALMDAIKSKKGFEQMKSKFDSLQKAASDIQDANILLAETR